MAVLGALALGTVAWAAAPSSAAGFTLQSAITPANVAGPTAVATASDGRVFVAQIDGVVKVFHGLSDTHPVVFADLRNEVYSAQGHGLLGMTLDPHFPTKPYVYVLYSRDSATLNGPISATKDKCATHATTGCVRYGRLARITANGDTMSAIKPLVNDWCNQFVHHIGALHFGADGFLYASAGEGATEIDSGGDAATDYGQFGNACGDPPSPAGTNLTAPTAQGGSLRAQDMLAGYDTDPTTLDGTVIRINPATGAAAPSNPYASSTDANKRRVVAFGLRNPFRFTVRPGTNDLYITDPGLDSYEEIDRVASPTATPAANFGWPCYEGPAQQAMWKAQNLNMCKSLYSANTAKKPVFAYPDPGHVVTGDSCLEADPEGNGGAITGISFYGGTAYPATYRKALFFVDWGRACLFAVPAGTTGVPNFAARKVAVGLPASGVVDIEPGPNGDLLLVNLLNSTVYALHYG